MDELARWLGEQLDEDERIARAASLGPWVQSGIGEYGWTVTFGRPGAGVETDDSEQGLADADFIAEFDPARVLREIDAKRRRLARHVPERRRLTLPDANGHATSLSFYVCTACTPNRTIEHGQDVIEFPCPDVRDDAAVYADRPGYREEWRP